MKAYDNRLGIIDASPSGVSGDKYLGALLDLGGKAESLRKVGRVVAESLPGTGDVSVKVRRVERGDRNFHSRQSRLYWMPNRKFTDTLPVRSSCRSSGLPTL